MTPDPHPSGDLPADTSQVIPLANYTPSWCRPTPAPTPCITQFVVARPAGLRRHPGQSRRPAGLLGRERRHRRPTNIACTWTTTACSIRQWTIDWGDGSDPQTDSPAALGRPPVSGRRAVHDHRFGHQPGRDLLGRHLGGPDHRIPVGIGGADGHGLQVTMAAMPPTLHVAGCPDRGPRPDLRAGQPGLVQLPRRGRPQSPRLQLLDRLGRRLGPPDRLERRRARPGQHSDGSPFLGALRSDTPDGPLTHVYTNVGTYYLAVTVTANGSGLSDTQTIPINVVELAPTIDGGCPPTTPATKATTVTLAPSAATTLTDPVAYDWQIVDSSGDTVAQSTDPSFSYTFTGPDTYTVSLVATVDAVTSAPATATITVNDVGPSFVNSTIPDVNASVGQTFTLPARGLHRSRPVEHPHRHDRLGRRHVRRRHGDGRVVGRLTTRPARSPTAMPTRASGRGTYTATITLTDESGVSATETFNVNVAAAAVTLNSFTASSDGSQLQVSYTVSDATAAPFNIDIYTSPDGTTPDQLLMSYHGQWHQFPADHRNLYGLVHPGVRRHRFGLPPDRRERRQLRPRPRIRWSSRAGSSSPPA